MSNTESIRQIQKNGVIKCGVQVLGEILEVANGAGAENNSWMGRKGKNINGTMEHIVPMMDTAAGKSQTQMINQVDFENVKTKDVMDSIVVWTKRSLRVQTVQMVGVHQTLKQLALIMVINV